MSKTIFHNSKALYAIGGSILFALLAFLLYTMGYYNFCYLEQWNTFIYDANYISNVLAQPGGCVQLASSFLTQFFIYPITGILITALLLTWIALLITDILYCWTGSRFIFPLALFPIAALMFLHYNTNYLYAGTIAFWLMLVCLRLYFLWHKLIARLTYSLISAFLLFVVAGPIAFLYSCLLLIIELFSLKRQALWFISLPLMVCLAAWVCLLLGLSGEWKHLLLPDGYFTLRLQAGSIIYLPWGLILSVFTIGGIYKLLRIKKEWIERSCCAILLIGAIAFTFIGASWYIDANNESFKELSYYARLSQWENIIGKCKQLPMNNLLFQNNLNLALAEKGRLADQLFEQPCIDIQTIYVVANKTPYISALLSDIYFSMGHIAFSQRYAFEANEAMNNFSPRMLQRLVQTNLIYGQYGTAQKYLNILEESLFYKDWAASHKPFLWNDPAVEADPVLGAKRRCLFPDNRFSGIKGLDDDLKQIVLQNPEHKATIQYLGSLYLLSKDIPRFKATLETFYDTAALPAVLPVCFQEGVLVFADGDQEVIKQYNIQASAVQRFEAFKQEPSKNTRNLWHFLKYRK
ncbi:hypothetical protein M2459_001421 [Parabacteroides sp. PF5-5]|uniref:DUF6057 family protein n=1 Tax=unclassified Parabacteroides TaxID=2649774 RepID=UPI002473CD7F|nr:MULTISPECIES: DUF6057 family protein [unclassified Parabacteroides]MDH6304685.1 hypothetical protein [Parabacteroides sp. PH5-39]MDH6315701.1 hypothetical protein [Parabacteroides sp. PF5-13]MDH6319361.1 hypothetical protein [Parabacteroides sp. PH5-13]MDH6323092.1 hypothetical protein [Parabacteroides sp. PH5-8]MDH6326894.1 hypothetical protein [Parabacteroides sp. PH5-41]